LIVSGIARKASLIALNTTLEKLRYVQGASWDMYRVCLPNTRTNVIDEALFWVNEADEANGAKILLLTAVAGAGKSTIAHTVAERCSQAGQLVSSFFFDRETEGRNNPTALFSTIAADLSRTNACLAARITAAIDNERGLPLAPISRQFEELVLKPSQDCAILGPLVIVIDALDEGWDEDMLKIFRDGASRLPGAFRIFLTSRMRPELDSLCRKAHVRLMSLDIDTPTNMHDIALFIPHRLKHVADDRNLGDDWPGEVLRSQFETRADGLFLWVATVCDYLRTRADPTRELDKLVSVPCIIATSAETQMDKLYATILESCNWDDEDFVAGYHQFMGIIIAANTPLTISALNDLFHVGPVASAYVLRQLSPLLTGTSEEDHFAQPVRMLHQSLRDFLVVRAGEPTGYAKLQIVEEEHIQNIALLCICILNRELSENTTGMGSLDSEVPGVSSIGDGQISEALWYACQFWTDHILDVESSVSAAVEEALQLFMGAKAVVWMEVMARRGMFRGLLLVRRWAQVSVKCFRGRVITLII
jgi:hypothetical protein